MADHGTFRRGELQRTASTPTEAVRLAHAGWRLVEPQAAERTPVALAHMTVADLRQYAASRGIDVGDATRKADMLAAIEDADGAAPAAGVEPVEEVSADEVDAR